MIQVGDGKFADMEVPVRVSGPFQVERFTVVEGQLDLLAYQLVDDRPVIDAADRDEFFAFAVKRRIGLPWRTSGTSSVISTISMPSRRR